MFSFEEIEIGSPLTREAGKGRKANEKDYVLPTELPLVLRKKVLKTNKKCETKFLGEKKLFALWTSVC